MELRTCLALVAGLVALTPFAPGARAAESPSAKPTLPLSELILYSSGVGYFQRDGQVDGQATVELQFKVDDINDLLKSMVVQDLDGGHASTVTYDSRDPLTKTLKSFGIDITSNPTLGQLLDQLRGEQVEVLHPNPLKGTILGVEKKTELRDEKRTVESEFLNLLSDDGLQSLPLSQVQKIKLLNERLNSELHQALQVLSSGHDTQKKTVAIRFDGSNKRRVSIAYVAQTPVWKTSYRLVLDDNSKPYLQGWAIVENTSDEDWDGVKLSLVSGRPISFTMDLYTPLYSARPVVQPELYTSLRPQVYGQAMDQLAETEEMAKAGRIANGGMRGAGVALQAGAAPPGAKPMSLGRRAMLREDLSLEPRAFDFQSVSAAAQGDPTGELFQYVIKNPVNLPRQKSAMLPIVSERVEGAKVSIYNEQVQAKYPLNGFRLKNTTSLHLMQGPITVFDDNTYAGDARMEDLAPGQERLISYALDLKTEVDPQSKSGPNEVLTVKLRKGTLVITRVVEDQKVYSVRNRDQKKKAVLIEHPLRTDWELIAPKEPNERTRDQYRFLVQVEPDKTQQVTVREQKRLSETVALADTAPDVILQYQRSRQASAEVKAALEKVVSWRDALSKTTAEKDRHELRVAEITQEQSRIRENMPRLSQTSDLYTRYVKKLDQQETELDTLRSQIERLKDQAARQQRELNDYLLSLNLD